MRPIVGQRSKLSLANFVLGSLTGLLRNRAMIVLRIDYSEGPDTGCACGNQHERTIHQSGSPTPFARFLSQSIAGAVVATAITTQPDLGSATRFLRGRHAGGLGDHIVAMSLGVFVDSGEQGFPTTT